MKQYEGAFLRPDPDELLITEQLILWLGLPAVSEWQPTNEIDIGQVRRLVDGLLLLQPDSRNWWIGVLLYGEDATLRQLLGWVHYCVLHKPAPCSSLTLNAMVMQWLFAPYDASS